MTGGLASVEEVLNLTISCKEDIIGLGLERGTELILLQLFALQQLMERSLQQSRHNCTLWRKGRVGWGGRNDEDSQPNSCDICKSIVFNCPFNSLILCCISRGG